MLRNLFCLLMLLVLGVRGIGGEGEKEVRGAGYAAPTQPPVTDDPPPDYVDDGNQHDDAEGVLLDDFTHYSLRQGARAEPDGGFRGTDYIHWLIHAATLTAWGQAQDGDPADATIVASEAWGAEIIDVAVEPSEGKYGTIRAENKVQFSYNYLVSGKKIGEASVQLMGTAVDIHGKRHSFQLSEHLGESTVVTEEEKRGLRITDYGKLEASLGAGVKGPRGSIDTKTSKQQEIYVELAVSVSRRLPKSAGDNDASPTVTARDLYEGETPLRKRYDVYSDGSVVLRARASEPDVTTLVKLQKFKIENSLRAWKSASDDPPPGDPPPPPPPSDPGNGGPTTPSGDPPPPPEPAEPATGGGDGPHDVDDDDDSNRSCTLSDGTRAFAEHSVAHGLAGEPATLPGRLRVRLDRDASADVEFAVTVDPPGALAATADRLVVAQGQRWGSLPFLALQPGTATATLTEANGNAALVIDVVADSIQSFATPRLWASLPGKAWVADRDLAARAVAGDDIGPLTVGRLGFAAFAVEDTDIAVAATDPNGILTALPAVLVIAAGERTASMPLRLNDAVGTATIALTAGERRLEVRVRSVAQEWRASPAVRVPVGTTALLPFRLLHAARGPRAVEAASADRELVTVDGADRRATVRAGETAWFFRVRGHAVGATQIELTSDGLPPLGAPVEVVAASVRIEEGRLELTELDPTRAGALRITAPDGVRITSVAVPPGSEDYLTVEGLGTGTVALRFLPHPDLPESLSLPLGWEGVSSQERFEFGILDTMHAPDAVVTTYWIEVP